MTQTYEQHKAVVDLAYPTPAIAWYLHADDPGHRHDDKVLAYTVMTSVEGTVKRYEAHLGGTLAMHRWVLATVVHTDGPRERAETFRTWPLLVAKVASDWEKDNEAGRVRIATELFARDFLADAGLVFETAPVATPATATLGGIRPNSATQSHWTLTPTFHADTADYRFTALNSTFLPVVTLGYVGQTVYWKRGTDTFQGIAPNITLNAGYNVIDITVLSGDRTQLRSYRLTVTLAE